MPRKAAFNPNMADLRALVDKYMGNQRTIRARYAAMAEREIADQRVEIQRRMATEFPNAGPSEFANSLGVGRSTIIRWLDEWANRHLDVASHDENVAHVSSDSPVFGKDGDTAYVIHEGRRLYLLTGDTFGYGETVEEADTPGNLITAPEWLTEDLMRQAVDTTGAILMYAPWDVRARAAAKKEKTN